MTTGKGKRQIPELLDFGKERIRVLHFTWIAFFITFYVWFNMAPMATTMLKSVNWLTKEHLKVIKNCFFRTHGYYGNTGLVFCFG